MIRWMRRVMAPQWHLWTWVIFYLACIGGDRLLGAKPMEGFWHIRGVLLYGGAFLYGLLRVVRSHPVMKSEYRDWLRISPWSPGTSLPFAPVYVVWQDAVVGAIVALFALWRGTNPVLPLSVGFAGYCVSLSIVFVRVRLIRWGLFALSLLGFLPALWAHPGLLAAAVAVSCFVMVVGIRASLRLFPWEIEPDWINSSTLLPTAKTLADGGWQTGWPHDYLAPLGIPRFSPCIRVSTALFASLGFGWLLFAFVVPLEAESRLMVLLLWSCVCIFLLPAVRLVVYGGNHRSPITFLGRLITFRWIIPQFDKVWLASLATLATGALGTAAIVRANVVDILPTGYMEPLFCALNALCVFLVLALPPSLKSWVLSGGHTVAPGYLRKPDYSEL